MWENGFSQYIVTDLLRKKYGYDGVVCTDWLITLIRMRCFIKYSPLATQEKRNINLNWDDAFKASRLF